MFDFIKGLYTTVVDTVNTYLVQPFVKFYNSVKDGSIIGAAVEFMRDSIIGNLRTLIAGLVGFICSCNYIALLGEAATLLQTCIFMGWFMASYICILAGLCWILWNIEEEYAAYKLNRKLSQLAA